MKILNIIPAYNEIFLLPYQLKHCQNNNINLFVIDNMSSDGTTEWLSNNNVPNIKLNTNGSFNLVLIQETMNKIVHKIKPDWVIYGAGDLFYEAKQGLRQLIEDADRNGFTQIEMKCRQLIYTGEIMKEGNPFCNYFLANKNYGCYVFISKYDAGLKFMPDAISIPNKVIMKNAGMIFEMHVTKVPKQRQETYARRQKAWKDGLQQVYGSHYVALDRKNFTFSQSEGVDIRTLPQEFELYKKLQIL